MGDVVKRLLTVVEPPTGMAWPPVYEVKSATEVNAQAWLDTSGTGTPQPRMSATTSLIEKIVDAEPDRLAFVMGHELAHITLGHVRPDQRGKTPLLKYAFTREQELAADRKGMEYAVAAGYSFRRALRGIHKLAELGPGYTSLEGLRSDHPSWKDRLAYLDQEQHHLWRAMSSFETGNSFLVLEQYAAAERCFRLVTRDFPECYEGWTNLGIALLMQYCDALDAEDLGKFQVGQIACPAFYRRPESLAARVRGINEPLWADATAAFREALRLRPGRNLPKAYLGIAYLVSPAGKDPVRAAASLSQALDAPAGDPEFSPMTRAATLINLAVAEIGRNGIAPAAQRLTEADNLLRQEAGRRAPAGAMKEALSYNQALLATLVTDASGRRVAADSFLQYLKTASPSTAWWSLAYRQYARLASDLGVEPVADGSLRRPAPAELRPVASLDLPDGKKIALAEPVTEVGRRFGTPQRIPVGPNSSLARVLFSTAKVEVLAGDQVLAIFLTDPAGPPLRLRTSGLTGRTVSLRPGMSRDDLEAALPEMDFDYRQIVDPEVNYRFYRRLGLAIRLKGGQVQEIVIAQVPERDLPGGR